LPRATVVIGAAAVSDFRPVRAATEKLRRSGPLTLELEPTEDILAEVGHRRARGTLLVAFAAETDSQNAVANGREKLLRKKADAIVVNDVSLPGLGFDSESNAATLLTLEGASEFPPMSKIALAGHILDEVVRLRAAATAQLSTV
jgi:phosphopantothenoylcysteine decarboxylase / phosphopantothenate---cysteine ligase